MSSEKRKSSSINFNCPWSSNFTTHQKERERRHIMRHLRQTVWLGRFCMHVKLLLCTHDFASFFIHSQLPPRCYNEYSAWKRRKHIFSRRENGNYSIKRMNYNNNSNQFHPHANDTTETKNNLPFLSFSSCFLIFITLKLVDDFN